MWSDWKRYVEPRPLTVFGTTKYLEKKEWILENYSREQYASKVLVIADSIRTKSEARLLETEWIVVSLIYRMSAIQGKSTKEMRSTSIDHIVKMKWY